MKVLLTGPFGKIGYRVIGALLDKGYDVLCFDLDTKMNRKVAKNAAREFERFFQHAEVVWGDITDKEAVKSAVNRVDAVINNAALIPPATDRNLALSEKINVGGTETIINAISEKNKNADKRTTLVFPSSVSVHGNKGGDNTALATASDVLKGEDNYASHKIRCEELLKASDIDWVIVRIGACMEGGNKYSMQDTKDLMGLMFSVHADVKVEYVHPKDVATAMANAIDNEEALHKILLLGGGESCRMTWREFNGLAQDAVGIGSFPREVFGNQGYYTHWMDTEESQRILQFQQHSLEDYRQELLAHNRVGRVLMRPFRPLIRRYLLSYSP